MKKHTIYDDYLIQLDDLLDKISKYGIDSITNHEKDFLDAYSSGDVKETDNKFYILNRDLVYENSNFKFELADFKKIDDDIHYIGTLYLPNIEFDNGKIVEGNLHGEIIVYLNGLYTIDFEKVVYFKGKEKIYEAFDFCGGLEYELDSFIDYIVQELK